MMSDSENHNSARLGLVNDGVRKSLHGHFAGAGRRKGSGMREGQGAGGCRFNCDCKALPQTGLCLVIVRDLR